MDVCDPCVHDPCVQRGWITERKDKQGRLTLHVHWRDKAGRHRSKSMRSGNRKAAEQYLAAKVAEVHSAPIRAQSSPTAALDAFLADIALSRAEATVALSRTRLSDLIAFWEGVPIEDWSPEHWRRYIRDRTTREHRPLGPATVIMAARVARGFIAWGRDGPWAIPNFLDGWQDPRAHSSTPDVLTRKERRTLLEFLRGDPCEVAAYLAAGMGLRPREWRRARAEDVRWHSAKLRVRRTKIYRDQELPIPPFVLDTLKRRAPKSGLLAGALIRSEHANAGQMLGRRCVWAGVPRMSWYGLRHTYATLLAERHPIHVVQAMLGHASITTTQRYLHAQEHHLRAAADEDL